MTEEENKNKTEDLVIQEETVETVEVKVESKHKIKDKHRLKHDSIFKGKKETLDESSVVDIDYNNKPTNFKPDVTSAYFFERENPHEYKRLNSLKMDLYDVVVNVIKLNITNSRRKPSKKDFNVYYSIAVDKLDMVKFSYSEVFLELAFYFSDSIENMFKLLDEKWGGKISVELSKKLRRSNEDVDLDDLDFQ